MITLYTLLEPFGLRNASLLAGMLDNKPQTWLGRLTEDFPKWVDCAERVQIEVKVFGHPV